jgi:hypothetical protein
VRVQYRLELRHIQSSLRVLGGIHKDGRELMHRRFRDDILTLTLPMSLFYRMEKDRRVSGSPSSFKGQMKIYAHKCNTADKKVTFVNLLILVQSKKPSGRFGRFLATGMNFGHSSLMSWGLGFIDIKSDIDVTDIGCGGGKLVKQLAGIILALG